MTVPAIPQGFNSITPYLTVDDAKAAIDFYKAAFGAEETLRLEAPDGKIGHAELRIGDSMIMLADEIHGAGNTSPKTLSGSPTTIMFYVEDCDVVFAQALASGGQETLPLTDQFYGDRSGTLMDPFGHVWTIGTHKEDLSPEDIAERMTQMG